MQQKQQPNSDGGRIDSVSAEAVPRGCLGLPPHYPIQWNTTSFIPNLSGQNTAALFSHLSIQNDKEEYMYGNGEVSTKRLKSQLSLSSLSRIADDELVGSWDDDPMKIDQPTTPLQKGEIVHHIALLSRHLSLPKNSTEMEKVLQYQDFVPCKMRAKRGCATHPRSIAERVRRTRITERMRKLQELVPNMDKQTNTSDMLDLAVDYIKDLQRQYKTLSNYRARCKCLISS